MREKKGIIKGMKGGARSEQQILPLMFFAAIGVMGLSITEFLYFCFRFIFKRRVIGKAAFNAVSDDEAVEEVRWNGKDSSNVKRKSRRSGRLAKRVKRQLDAGIDPSKKQKGMLVRGRHGRFICTTNEVADYIPIKRTFQRQNTLKPAWRMA